MGDDQGANAIQREFDKLVIGPRTEWRCIGALEQAAVDENAAALRDMQLVAGTGYAVLGAVMCNVRVFHQLVPYVWRVDLVRRNDGLSGGLKKAPEHLVFAVFCVGAE